jgi:hypothetical protein
MLFQVLETRSTKPLAPIAAALSRLADQIGAGASPTQE